MEAQHQHQHQPWMMSAQATITATPAPSVTTYSSLPYHQPTTHEEVRTLWIGDLPYWADESYLNTWFSPAAQVSPPPFPYLLLPSQYTYLSLFRFFGIEFVPLVTF